MRKLARWLIRLRRLWMFCLLCTLAAVLLLLENWPERLPDIQSDILAAMPVAQFGMTLAGLLAVGGAMFIWAAVAHALAALLFGRVFCSWLCPLGGLQEFALLILRPTRRRKPWSYAPRRWYHYLAPVLFLAALCLGFGAIYGLAEPYSIFSRAITHLIQPLYALTANLLPQYIDIQLAHVPVRVSVPGMIFGLIPIGFVLWIMGKKGRTWCAYFCPAGALLGWLGGAAWIRPRFTTHCIGCRACERSCPSHCVDVDKRRIDSTACVACYACVSACAYQGMSLLPQPVPRNASRAAMLGSAAAVLLLAGLPPRLRERFPKSAALPEAPLLPPGGPPTQPVLPPGSISLERMEALCTGCHTCVSVCPSGVLDMSGPLPWKEKAALRMGMPALNFARAFCQIGCVRCTQYCPNRALIPLDTDVKARMQLGISTFIEELCVIVTQKTRCGACAEHCPTGALTMRPPVTGGAALPHIDPERCIGCGACEYACPVRPVRSVAVRALPVHGQATPPLPKEGGDIQATDQFPF